MIKGMAKGELMRLALMNLSLHYLYQIHIF